MRLIATFITVFLCISLALPAYAQSGSCQFILGFQTLHELDPTDIGDCTDNQAFAGNGDAQQHTTKGLLAWRKADNWTAFTNGYMTWINGPDGVVHRLNTERFRWEHDQLSEADYRRQAGAIIQTLSNSVTQVLPLLAQPHLGDAQWTSQVDALLGAWHTAYQQIQQLTPPSSLAAAHALILQALSQYDTAATDLSAAGHQQDNNRLQASIGEMTNAASALKQAAQTSSSGT